MVTTSLLYIDTNALIYLFEANLPFAETVASVMRDHMNRGGEFLTSVVTLTELLAGRPGGRETLATMPAFRVVNVDAAIAEQAGLLRQQQPALKSIDALHVATALRYDANQFLTNDRQLITIAKKWLTMAEL